MIYSANKFCIPYTAEIIASITNQCFLWVALIKMATQLIPKIPTELKISSCPTHCSSRYSRPQFGDSMSASPTALFSHQLSYQHPFRTHKMMIFPPLPNLGPNKPFVNFLFHAAYMSLHFSQLKAAINDSYHVNKKRS